MKKEYKSDLEKLRDSIDIHRVSAAQRKIKVSNDLGDIKIPKKVKVEVIGSGEHTIFVFDSMPTMKKVNKNIDKIVSDRTSSKIRSKIFTLAKKRK